jgi:hypothetical protein
MGRQRLSATDHLVLKILTPATPSGDVANGQQSPLRAQNGTTATARTPVLPEATPVGVLSALLRRSLFARQLTALDPLLPFLIGPMNGRDAQIPAIRRWFDERVRSTRCCPSRLVRDTEGMST